MPLRLPDVLLNYLLIATRPSILLPYPLRELPVGAEVKYGSEFNRPDLHLRQFFI
ncbi:MAG: hypothetical protein KDI79_24950 [Anaerolineae bacterium]|nr:hypothetical protein [Anaerolineae bacterium]